MDTSEDKDFDESLSDSDSSGPSVGERSLGQRLMTPFMMKCSNIPRFAREIKQGLFKRYHPSLSLSRSYVWAGQFSGGWMIYGSSQ